MANVNAKVVEEVVGDALKSIYTIIQELKKCEVNTNKIIEYCNQLDEYDGRKIIFSTDIPTLDLDTSDEWYRCYILGHEELLEHTLRIQNRLIEMKHVLNTLYDRFQSIDSSSEVLTKQVRKIEDVLSNGGGVSALVGANEVIQPISDSFSDVQNISNQHLPMNDQVHTPYQFLYSLQIHPDYI